MDVVEFVARRFREAAEPLLKAVGAAQREEDDSSAREVIVVHDRLLSSYHRELS